MYELIEKNRCWTWTLECEEAFQSLKRSFCESPVLAYPDFMCPFRLDVDASMCGLGAILSQKTKEGERVIAYASPTLSKTEKQYCATHREILALVWACKFFRPYLLGQKFTVRTDHHALQWLTKFKEPEEQVARWLESLAEFEMVVIHQPGKAHVNVDVLSQRPCNSCGLVEQ